jgi:hypothetical protein
VARVAQLRAMQRSARRDAASSADMPYLRQGLHILVVVPGRLPVIVLERAFAQLGQERRMPHEIHVIATARQLADVQPLFSGNGAGRFSQLCAAAGFPRDEILFNQRTLHVADDLLGDCTGAADRMLQVLRQLSAAGRASLTAVITGDAGALGHLLHAALHIVAGTDDRLLLDDAHPRGTRRRPPTCDYVEVPLLLWPANEPLPATFAEAVRRRRLERRRVVRPDPLRLDVRRRVVSVGETSFRLPAMQFFWLYYLASTPGERFPLAEIVQVLSTARRSGAQVTQKLSDGRVRTFPGDVQRAFIQLYPQAGDKFDAMFQRACGPQPGLPSTISKINAALRCALGRGAQPYLIQGGRGAGGYRLTLPAAVIQIVEVKRA